MPPLIADALASALPQAQSRTQTAAASSASDFQSFLRLLTAQLRNQDPLSPLDSTQFVEQLASFSAVEQQIETNRLLSDLATGASTSGLETATLWIGKDVEAQSPAVQFSGEPLAFAPPAGAAGDFVIRNAANEVVFRQPLGAARDIIWDGRTSGGVTAPVGDYAVAIERTGDDGAVTSSRVSVIARVTEARLIDGTVRLILDNGVAIEPAAVEAIRDSAPRTAAA